MATSTVFNTVTIAEVVKRLNAGKLMKIAEVLEEKNDILRIIPFVEANSQDHHVGSVRSHLPGGTWREYNRGVPTKASAVVQRTAGIGMLEARSEIDVDLAKRSGNPSGFRMTEDTAFVEGMSQDAVEALIYGNNKSDPAKITGLAEIYNALSMPNVHSAGGTGSDLTSIWMVEFGERKVTGIYPRGSQAGLQQTDKGQQTVEDADGNKFEAFVSLFKFDMGLMIYDDDAVQRLCNIESDATVAASSLPALERWLTYMRNSLPSRGRNAAILANIDGITLLERLAMEKANVLWGTTQIWGRDITTFRQVPIIQTDGILSTESAVS